MKTGDWRDSDVMDGSDAPEPVASLKRLLSMAYQQQADVYVFGRFYREGDGVHDTHMNQGSTGEFLHRAAAIPMITTTPGRTAPFSSISANPNGLPISPPSTSSSCRQTISAIRCPARRPSSAPRS